MKRIDKPWTRTIIITQYVLNNDVKRIYSVEVIVLTYLGDGRMIFYFSATGNSEHVARSIAETNDDRLAYIPDLLTSGELSFDVSGEKMIGFVSPTYYWGLPTIVEDFLRRLELSFEERPYTFFVATYGTKNGAITQVAERILKDKGVDMDASYEVRMPDTWTPVFDLTNEENISKREKTADEKLEEVMCQIASRSKGVFMKDRIPEFISKMFYSLYVKARRTENLTVEEHCTGCGRCAEFCPVHAIKMCDGRPEWTMDSCVMCLGCLHRCPSFAIQYWDKTKGHGQYINPHCPE